MRYANGEPQDEIQGQPQNELQNEPQVQVQVQVQVQEQALHVEDHASNPKVVSQPEVVNPEVLLDKLLNSGMDEVSQFLRLMSNQESNQVDKHAAKNECIKPKHKKKVAESDDNNTAKSKVECNVCKKLVNRYYLSKHKQTMKCSELYQFMKKDAPDAPSELASNMESKAAEPVCPESVPSV
jgi:hypothetical protein